MLQDIFRPFPNLDFREGDFPSYRHFRVFEPNLVSFADGKEPAADSVLQVVTLYYCSEPIGVVSYGVQTNTKKPGNRNRFGRIDLVIMDPFYRGVGAGKALVLCSLTHLLRAFGDRVYSISCLAAHGAIQKMLEDLAFAARGPAERGYVHEELRLGEGAAAPLANDLARKAEDAVRQVNYTLRQQRGAP